VGTIVFGKALLRDRDEEEVRGYRKALDLIHTKGANLPLSDATIRQLHSLSRGGQLTCEIRGPKSLWHKTVKWNLRNT
jgi:hypothetical protein